MVGPEAALEGLKSKATGSHSPCGIFPNWAGQLAVSNRGSPRESSAGEEGRNGRAVGTKISSRKPQDGRRRLQENNKKP